MARRRPLRPGAAGAAAHLQRRTQGLLGYCGLHSPFAILSSRPYRVGPQVSLTVSRRASLGSNSSTRKAGGLALLLLLLGSTLPAVAKPPPPGGHGPPAASTSAAGTLPAGLPPTFWLGVASPPDGLSWMTGSGVAWDARYQYLAGGVNTGNGWST